MWNFAIIYFKKISPKAAYTYCTVYQAAYQIFSDTVLFRRQPVVKSSSSFLRIINLFCVEAEYAERKQICQENTFNTHTRIWRRRGIKRTKLGNTPHEAKSIRRIRRLTRKLCPISANLRQKMILIPLPLVTLMSLKCLFHNSDEGNCTEFILRLSL